MSDNHYLFMQFIFFRFKDRSYGTSGATSGLTSSLAFTPVQVWCFPVTLVSVRGSLIEKIDNATEHDKNTHFSSNNSKMIEELCTLANGPYPSLIYYLHLLTCLYFGLLSEDLTCFSGNRAFKSSGEPVWRNSEYLFFRDWNFFEDQENIEDT